MKKHLPLFFIFLFFFLNNLYSQSSKNYFTASSEVLKKTQHDAADAGDYQAAAEIKKELDYRESEKRKLDSLQVILDESVKKSDYTKAAEIQPIIKDLKNKLDKEGELRKNIASSILKEDYESAAKQKSELEEIIFGAPLTQTIVNNNNTAPSHSVTPSYFLDTTKTNSTKTPSAKGEKTHKDAIMYSPNSSVLFGIMFCGLNQKRVGTYLSFRCNGDIGASSSSSYYISGNKINNSTYSWEYENGTSTYSRWEVNLGFTAKAFGNVNKVSGYALLGMGYSNIKYIYAYKKYYNQSGDYDVEHIKNKDISGGNWNLEAIFLINFKWVNIHVGGSLVVPRVKESVLVYGIGFAF